MSVCQLTITASPVISWYLWMPMMAAHVAHATRPTPNTQWVRAQMRLALDPLSTGRHIAPFTAPMSIIPRVTKPTRPWERWRGCQGPPTKLLNEMMVAAMVRAKEMTMERKCEVWWRYWMWGAVTTASLQKMPDMCSSANIFGRFQKVYCSMWIQCTCLRHYEYSWRKLCEDSLENAKRNVCLLVIGWPIPSGDERKGDNHPKRCPHKESMELIPMGRVWNKDFDITGVEIHRYRTSASQRMWNDVNYQRWGWLVSDETRDINIVLSSSFDSW